MFTLRSASQGNASPAPPQSIEAVRRRARHRLIGAAVLVVLGVVGFSLLFDTQPRPLPVDIPIVIPAKNAQPPLKAPESKPAAAASTPAHDRATTTAQVAASESLGSREEVVEPVTAPKPVAPAPVPATAAVPAPAKAPPESPARAEPVTKAEAPKPAAKPAPSEAERARALLEGKAPEAAGDAGGQRIVVQVGAFADAARAREARLKLERAGLKTYTHVAQTADGQRIRVRVGPFATKAEADKAAARVKALGLPAAILTL